MYTVNDDAVSNSSESKSVSDMVEECEDEFDDDGTESVSTLFMESTNI